MAAENSSLDTLECLDLALMTLPFNRRVTLRYPCGLATATSVKLDESDPYRRALGHNISQGGMGLILQACPEVGTIVHIRVRNCILNFTYDLAARIVHTVPNEYGEWLVGLAFARQLSLAELASLLYDHFNSVSRDALAERRMIGRMRVAANEALMRALIQRSAT